VCSAYMGKSGKLHSWKNLLFFLINVVWKENALCMHVEDSLQYIGSPGWLEPTVGSNPNWDWGRGGQGPLHKMEEASTGSMKRYSNLFFEWIC
jgi:hypothetical protein